MPATLNGNAGPNGHDKHLPTPWPVGTTSRYVDIDGKTYHYLLTHPPPPPPHHHSALHTHNSTTPTAPNGNGNVIKGSSTHGTNGVSTGMTNGSNGSTETSSPTKPTILLLHGFPGLPYDWRYQVGHLTARGWPCLIPTMLGFGETSAPDDLRHWAWKSLAADLTALVDDAVGVGESVVVGGHDWGGALAWRFALYFPERTRAVWSLTLGWEGGFARTEDGGLTTGFIGGGADGDKEGEGGGEGDTGMGMGMDGHATSNGHNNKNDTPVTSNGEGQHLNLNGHTNGHTNGHNGNTTTTTITTTTADPAPTLDPIEAGVRSGQTPTLGYQLQFRDPATLKRLQASPDDGIRQLLYGFWGSLTSTGERCFTPSSGLIWSQLPDMQPPPDHIISAADAAVYLDAYASSGGGILRGPLNWYKNMPLNVADETALARAHGGAMPGFAMPALFVQALGDDILVPELWGAMEGGEEEGKKGGFKRLDWVKVDWGHFCLWEGREEINGILERWLEGLEEVRGRSGEGEIR